MKPSPRTGHPLHPLVAKRWIPRSFAGALPDALKARELAPQERKPMNDMFTTE